MIEKRPIILAAAVVVFATVLTADAQPVNESKIEGVVRDQTGAALSNAIVTLEGSSLIGGARSLETDYAGAYRFNGLPGGTYQLTATAPSFSTLQRGPLALPLGATLTIDFELDLAPTPFTVKVEAPSPMVDVKSSATPTRLDQDMLLHLPTSRAIVDLINLAPGVTKATFLGTSGSVAFGGTQGSNGLLVDGVNLTEPQSGEPRLTMNQNWIQEVQVVALGAGVEYGRTTGATLEAVIRSGENQFAGLAEYWTTRSSWSADNTPQRTLTPRDILSLWDANVQVGGPIRRDRVWFFAGSEYYRDDGRPAGVSGPDYTAERIHRHVGKLNLRFRPHLLADTMAQIQDRDVRNAELSTYLPTSEAAYRIRARDGIWNARLRWVVGDASIVEIRTRGYDSPLSNDSMLPDGNRGPAPRIELTTEIGSANTSLLGKHDRSAVSVAGSLTHHTNKIFSGSHELRVGLESERATGTDFEGYPENRFYHDFEGAPFQVELWDGNRVRYTNHQTALFVQDSWALTPRIAINGGVRVDVNRGSVPGLGTVLATNPVSPRIGVAWDVAADHRTVVKWHYGRYSDPLYASHYNFKDRVGLNPRIIAEVVGPNQFVELERFDSAAYVLGHEIRPPHVAQLTLSVEHELAANLALHAGYIRRSFDDFIGAINATARWVPVSRQDPGPDGRVGTTDDGVLLNLYQRVNPQEQSIVVTNPDGAFRRYDALQIIARKRYGQGWQLLGGYTWSRNDGNVGSGGTYANARLTHYDLGTAGVFMDPNRLIHKAAPFSSRELKMSATYSMTGLAGLNVSGVFRHVSGAPLRRRVLFTGLTARPTSVIAEPSISEYLPAQTSLDVRLEKTFAIARRSVGLFVDVFNVANHGAPTWVVADSGPRFGQVMAWTDPRTARAAIRFSF